MATTSGERRKVARLMRGDAACFRRLREEVGGAWTVDLGDVPAIFQDITHYVGLDGVVRADALFDRLADLVDPTCHVVSTISQDWSDGSTVYEHEFSCGHTLETSMPEPPAFCDECGARVVDE